MADVTMPQLGETVTEGTITKWFKQVGDKVDPDEVLFEVSTDKVDSEVPSPAGGFIDESKSAPAPAAPAAPAAATPAPAPAAPAEAAPAAVAPAAAPSAADDEVVAFSNIRKRTAEHMVRSQATSAHVLTAVEVDFEN